MQVFPFLFISQIMPIMKKNFMTKLYDADKKIREDSKKSNGIDAHKFPLSEGKELWRKLMNSTREQ